MAQTARPTIGYRWARGGVRLAAALGVVALAAACASTDTSSSSTTAPGSAAASGTSITSNPEGGEGATAPGPGASIEVEAYTGDVAGFYAVPDPLPAGQPGNLIRTMPIEAPAGEVGLRIMYHSTDAEGDDRAVTGVVFYPETGAPEEGWPVVAWAHGTSGLAARCAPSRRPESPPGFGIEGVRVATDYIGLGPDGELHPYLTAAAEANAVIDSVAAVRSLPDARAGAEWVVAGVSQGGHAALMTNELAAERLPGSPLLGAVAIAPGSQLSQTYGDEVQANMITTLVLAGVAAEDPDVVLEDYLGPAALEVAPVIESGCIGEYVTAMVPVATAPDYFIEDPRTSALGEEWLAVNDPGQVRSDSPLFVVQGGADIVVLPARTAALLERLCGIGQVVETFDIPTADHNTITGQAEAEISAWIAARFAGDPVVDGCP